MPRTPVQLQHAREARRQILLTAGLAVFARNGYEGASIRAIAQEAGVAQGLLYSYFASKEVLLHAIFEASMNDVRGAFEHAAGATTPQQELEQLLRSSFSILDSHRDFWRLSYSVRMQPTVLAAIGDVIHEWIMLITTTLEAHLQALHVADAPIEAIMLFAQIDGIAQHYVLDPEHFPLELVITKLIARYNQ